MEYAIIEIGGRQVWVEKGRHFVTNRLPVNQGDEVSLTRVLLVNKNGNVSLGKPYLDSTEVTGTVVEHFRGPKVLVYKMKSKKRYRRKQGHRQEMTKVIINEINV